LLLSSCPVFLLPTIMSFVFCNVFGANFCDIPASGGKKNSYYHDDLWTMKYLPRFKWHHLTDKTAYDSLFSPRLCLAKKNSSAHSRPAAFSSHLDISSHTFTICLVLQPSPPLHSIPQTPHHHPQISIRMKFHADSTS